MSDVEIPVGNCRHCGRSLYEDTYSYNPSGERLLTTGEEGGSTCSVGGKHDLFRYLATINTPGYLPTDDDPPTFDTAAEAWAYLTEERTRAEDEVPEWTDHTCDFPADCEYSETMVELAQHEDAEGTVVGLTPGYDGDHDLGLAYCVTKVEEGR